MPLRVWHCGMWRGVWWHNRVSSTISITSTTNMQSHVRLITSNQWRCLWPDDDDDAHCRTRAAGIHHFLSFVDMRFICFCLSFSLWLQVAAKAFKIALISSFRYSALNHMRHTRWRYTGKWLSNDIFIWRRIFVFWSACVTWNGGWQQTMNTTSQSDSLINIPKKRRRKLFIFYWFEPTHSSHSVFPFPLRLMLLRTLTSTRPYLVAHREAFIKLSKFITPTSFDRLLSDANTSRRRWRTSTRCYNGSHWQRVGRVAWKSLNAKFVNKITFFDYETWWKCHVTVTLGEWYLCFAVVCFSVRSFRIRTYVVRWTLYVHVICKTLPGMMKWAINANALSLSLPLHTASADGLDGGDGACCCWLSVFQQISDNLENFTFCM